MSKSRVERYLKILLKFQINFACRRNCQGGLLETEGLLKMIENFSLSYHTVHTVRYTLYFKNIATVLYKQYTRYKFMTTVTQTIILMPKEKHSSRVKSTGCFLDPRMIRPRPAILFLALLQQRIDYGVVGKLQTASVRRPLFGIIVPNRENAREDEYRILHAAFHHDWQRKSIVNFRGLATRIPQRTSNFLRCFQIIGKAFSVVSDV